MKNKARVRFIALIGIVSVLLCAFFMYFSHDVSELNQLYPQRQILLKDRPGNWVTLEAISKYGVEAIVLTEDWGFYDHGGIDFNQIRVALGEMLAGERFRGASTITQQMIRTVYLNEDRNLWRKLHEIILSLKAERSLSKNKILEIYFNVVEFGPGIFGIKNASKHYFNKSPSELNPRESAFLAMLLPSPIRYYESFRNKKLSPFAEKRIDEILVKMRIGKVLTMEEYQMWRTQKFIWEK